jgi:arylsulfatase A-like enzyme
VGAAGAQPAASTRPPNLVVILADDLGWGDVCAYGCARGRTPHLDELAAGGARFTQAYVTAPVCSPSRAALLTGRYQQRFGHEFNAGGTGRAEKEGLGTPVTERMLPQYLGERGYATGMIGKWHLGSQPQFHPMARGFDEFFGFLHAAHLYSDPDAPGVHYADRGPRRGGKLERDAGNPLLRGREPVEEREYLTHAFTREAVSFIERHRQEPFFLYVAYNAPHTPLQATDELWQRFPEIEDEGERVYAAMVSALDDGVGAIVGALERAGVREQTLVVFTSDNGCGMYTDSCSNGPLLGGKVTFFEGGVRVPFLASWPGTLRAGQVLGQPVSTLDVLPTALALTHAEPPADRELDGESLAPLLRGEGRGPSPDRALFWRNGASWAMRRGPWKLIAYDGEAPFLFDLAADVGEGRNLAPSEPARVAELTRLYQEWNAHNVAPRWPTRITYHAVLADILARRPFRLLEAPAPGTIEVEF